MIKYLGSKRLFTEQIRDVVKDAHPEARSFFDVFSGTSRVGHAMKNAGFHVVANDYLRCAHAIARCYVAADKRKVAIDARRLIDEMARAKPRAGWFTQTFCEDARYLHPKNGERVEGARVWLESKSLAPELEGVLLTSLLEAADRVDSTCGVQMAYLKKWAARAHNDLELRMPALVDGAGEAHLGLAEDVAPLVETEVAYLDPPYNQHSYLGNYHVWESLVAWDAPDAYGIARKRVECRTKKSAFNSKREVRRAFGELIAGLRAELIVVSFNNEGYLDRDEVIEVLRTRGEVEVRTREYKRYVGAQIGIYNPQGERVGKVSHLQNREHLFVVRTPALVEKTRLAS